MGGPNPEERGPESDERDGATAAEDAPPSAAPAPDAGDNGGNDEKNEDGKKDEESSEKKQTTTIADRGGHAEPQAQDGDAPPRFKGVTKWFNSQKGNRERCCGPWKTSARREGIDCFLGISPFGRKGSSGMFSSSFLLRRPPCSRLSSTSKRRWQFLPLFSFPFFPRAPG